MSYKFDGKTLTVETSVELYQFHSDWSSQSQKMYPKKLIIAGKNDISTINLGNMLRHEAFDFTREIEISEDVSTMKAIGNIVYSKDGKTLIAAPEGLKGEVAIPEGVETIGYRAFTRCKICKVEFPESLKLIDARAFAFCTQLKSIDLKNVEIINASAFHKCERVKSLKFGSKLKEVGYGAFIGIRINEITIPEGVEKIEDEAFSHGRLKEVYLPDSLTYIGDGAFSSVNKVHIKKYHPGLLAACLNYIIPIPIFAKDSDEILLIENNGFEIVVPKNVHKDNEEKMSAKLKNYFNTKSRLIIDDLFFFAYDNGRKEYVAFEILSRYESKPAVEFLNKMAADTAMRCNTEEALLEILKMKFWSENSLKSVLEVAENRGWIQASAIILNEIGRTEKKEGKLSL